MRAVVYTANGPSSVLSIVERERPEPGPGEVLVRLVRAGVNPTDWKSRAGQARPMTYDEVSPGLDGAGTVEAVGEGVTTYAVGDRVWVLMAQAGRAYGTAVESTLQPVANVAPLPESASYDVGASLGVPAVTAHRALTVGEDTARLEPGALSGQTVLVQGGAGAVGNAAIQLAVWAGATVIATVSSPEKATLATAAGAHHVVDYRTEDVTSRVREIAPDGVDLVVEVSMAANLATDLDVIRNRGTVAYYADNGGAEASLPVRAAFALNVRLQGVLLYSIGADAIAAAVEDITRALEDGAIRVGEDAGLPLHHVDLADTAAAHDAVEGGAVGKVLIDL